MIKKYKITFKCGDLKLKCSKSLTKKEILEIVSDASNSGVYEYDSPNEKRIIYVPFCSTTIECEED